MNLLVVSPHLDDAAYSFGATISYLVRKNVNVTVLTVLAGDPSVDGPASHWDRRCGFESAQSACHSRRAEDTEALALLGAEPRWLPFQDDGYETARPREAAVRAAIRSSLDNFEAVAIPTWPLAHPDHRWVTEMAASVIAEGVVTIGYEEEPYASLALARSVWSYRRSHAPSRSAGPRPRWSVAPTSRLEYQARAAAVRCYRSQRRPMRHLMFLAKAIRLILPREHWTLLRSGDSELVTLLGGPHADCRPT